MSFFYFNIKLMSGATPLFLLVQPPLSAVFALLNLAVMQFFSTRFISLL